MVDMFHVIQFCLLALAELGLPVFLEQLVRPFQVGR